MIKRIIDKVYHKLGILKRFNAFIIGSNESETIRPNWRGEELPTKREYSLTFSTDFKKNQIKTIQIVSQILFNINRLVIANGDCYIVKSIKIDDNELLEIENVPATIFHPNAIGVPLNTICKPGQKISLTIKRIK